MSIAKTNIFFIILHLIYYYFFGSIVINHFVISGSW